MTVDAPSPPDIEPRREVVRARSAAAPAQVHDAFFKWAFTQREHAAGLLRA